MKFLHISDLHFSQSNSNAETSELCQKFKEYAIEKNIVVEEVFFTGDLRDATHEHCDSAATVTAAVGFLRNIASCVGVTEDEHIHIVPGNHDLTRTGSKEESVECLKKVYTEYNRESGLFDGKFGNVSYTDYLKKRFSFFEKCVTELQNEIWSDFLSNGIHRVNHFEKFSIIYLNTAIASGRGAKTDKGNLFVNSCEIREILVEIKEKNSGKPVLVLSHYNISDIEDKEKEKIKNLFKDHQLDIVWFCGDAHKTAYDESFDVVYITAGSFIKRQQGAEASFFVGDLCDASLNIEAHGYDSTGNLSWELKDGTTRRLNAALASFGRQSVATAVPIDGSPSTKFIYDVSKLKTINFYSYKGGVGRTGLTVQIARCLAALGKKVVIVDFDFEAPSFPVAFAKNYKSAIDTDNGGLYDIVCEYQKNVDSFTYDSNISHRLIDISDIILNGENRGGQIQVIPCGYINTAYFQDVSENEWSIMLDKGECTEETKNCLLTRFIENVLKPELEKNGANYLLIDSASGISDYSRISRQVSDVQTVILCPSEETKYALKNYLFSAFINEDSKSLRELIFVVSRVPPELSDLRDEVFTEMEDLIKKGLSTGRKNSNILKLHSDLHMNLNSRIRDIDERYLNDDKTIDIVHIHEDIIEILISLCQEIVFEFSDLSNPQKIQAQEIWSAIIDNKTHKTKRFKELKVTYENRLFGLLESGEMQNYDDKKRNVAFKVETFLRILNHFYKTSESKDPVNGQDTMDEALLDAGFQCGKEFGKALVDKWLNDNNFNYQDATFNIKRWCEFDTRAGFGILDYTETGNAEKILIVNNLFIISPEDTGGRDYSVFFTGYVAGVLIKLLGRDNSDDGSTVFDTLIEDSDGDGEDYSVRVQGGSTIFRIKQSRNKTNSETLEYKFKVVNKKNVKTKQT
jgi:MinD-like ATPase involved in chromosome partitioning or flagellar assembly/predicted phosphodiesterase